MSQEVRELCDWFLSVDRGIFPNIPFRLTPWQMVTGEGFYDVLTREAMDAIDYLNGDRDCPPVRLSGLLNDLKALKLLDSAQIEDDTDW